MDICQGATNNQINKMILQFSGDYYDVSGFDDLIFSINNNKLDDYFIPKSYGNDLNKIFIVSRCLKKENEYKPSIRLRKSDSTLLIDIMFDLKSMIKATKRERREIFIKKINEELPPIIKKYKFKDFDLERFMADFNTYVKEIEFLTSTNYWVEED